jgi:phenylacetate-CoA ligase
MRQEIESRFAMHAVDLYGLSEVMGPGVAVECIESKDGLHIWEDHFYPEIIDPESGAVLPDGELGELVWTSLTKEAFPVIRYRSRDLTRLLPGTARSVRRMEKVTGRSDDMLIIRGVNVFPSQIEEIILKDERVSPHYVLEVRREGPLDRLDVVVEATTGFAGANDAARTAASGDLQHHIKALVGVTASVRIAAPGEIARSQGKAVRVIDHRKGG